MRIEDYNKIQEEIFDGIRILRDKKGHDYAVEEDTLKNFKTVSNICSLLGVNPGSSPGDVCLFFLVVKIARLANLKSKDPKNESVADTIQDLINYACLWLGCREDENW